MCLTLNESSKPLIAEEDIVCYKVIKESSSLPSLKHGDIVTFIPKRNKNETLTGKFDTTNWYGEQSVVNIETKHIYLISKISSIIHNGKECIKRSYFTMYRFASVSIGETYYSEIEVKDNTIERALHSFVIKHSAFMVSCYNSSICKCIIPKGSTYYTGKFGNHDSYASNALKYIELI